MSDIRYTAAVIRGGSRYTGHIIYLLQLDYQFCIQYQILRSGQLPDAPIILLIMLSTSRSYSFTLSPKSSGCGVPLTHLLRLCNPPYLLWSQVKGTLVPAVQK